MALYRFSRLPILTLRANSPLNAVGRQSLYADPAHWQLRGVASVKVTASESNPGRFTDEPPREPGSRLLPINLTRERLR